MTNGEVRDPVFTPDPLMPHMTNQQYKDKIEVGITTGWDGLSREAQLEAVEQIFRAGGVDLEAFDSEILTDHEFKGLYGQTHSRMGAGKLCRGLRSLLRRKLECYRVL